MMEKSSPAICTPKSALCLWSCSLKQMAVKDTGLFHTSQTWCQFYDCRVMRRYHNLATALQGRQMRDELICAWMTNGNIQRVWQERSTTEKLCLSNQPREGRIWYSLIRQMRHIYNSDFWMFSFTQMRLKMQRVASLQGGNQPIDWRCWSVQPQL